MSFNRSLPLPLALPVRRGVSAHMAALALPALLLVALAIRAVVVFSQTYVVFLDETFQYLEQAHRLAFGSGVLPWEFQDGIRSWLLPGLIAPLMWAADLATNDPRIYIAAIRLGCVTLSLTVVLAAFRMADRREGLAGAVLAAGFSAVWFDLVWFSPAILTEVLAAHVALLAILLADGPQGSRRLLLAGACFGLAVCIRYQYGPALLAATLCQNGTSWRRWRLVLLGGLCVVLPVGGLLDWLTWGSPFQSMWLNFKENSLLGVSSAMGTEPAGFHLAYLAATYRPWPIGAALIGIGMMRAPALAAAAVVTVALHAAVPHKEVRFIYLAIAIAPMLAGLGAAAILRRIAETRGRLVISYGTALVLAAVALLSWQWATSATFSVRWRFERANLEAFLAANRQPALCGLGVKDIPFYQGGGYAYLHRAVPIYYKDFEPARLLPGSSVTMRLDILLNGRSVVQFPGAMLDSVVAHYNFMIAEKGHEAAGFTPLQCFDDMTHTDQAGLCLYRRKGGCS